MSDFGPDFAGGFNRFESDIKKTFEAVSILQAQVAARTAYVAHLGSSAKDEDISTIKGAAQETVRYLSTPFGISSPVRQAAEYVDRVHEAARKASGYKVPGRG
jgi:hypothetical protein